VATAEGTCEGIISTEPRGENGFGYDPLFFVPEYGKTFAELNSEEKNAISHRGRALNNARKILDNLIAG
jgi:XTP/dITP diphosphohydrolase